VTVYGVIKNSLNAFLSVVLTEDNDGQESRKTRVIKGEGIFMVTETSQLVSCRYSANVFGDEM